MNDIVTREPEALERVETEAAEETTPERLVQFARANPGKIIAGGLALGVLAGALLRPGSARKLAKGALAAAAVGGEAGLAWAKHARDKAQAVSGEAVEQLGELGDSAGEHSRRLHRRAAAAAGSATGAGIDLARAAIRLVGSLRR